VKFSVKVGALASALAAGTAIVVPMALPAGAAAPKASVSCAKETSPPLKAGKTIVSTIAACTPAALAAGGASTTSVKSGQTKGTVTDTIVWKGKKGTTVAVIKYGGAKTLGKCKAPYDTRVTITGKVSKSTGAAAAIVKKGEPITASICAISKAGATQGKTILEPGTKFKV
jgi:hypothetical protein